MTDTFFNDYSGLTTLNWWLGQIVDEKNWVGNENSEIHKRNDIPGWGKRYKVRIFGRDTKTKDTADDHLEMAEVLYPVTAGSGHAGACQTANLRQGSFVIGFYKDGIDATEPIIMGVLGNNSQTKLLGKDPREGFVPRSGYKGLTGDKPLSTKNIYTEGPSSLPIDESGNVNPLSNNVNLVDQVKDGSPCEFIPKTRACEGPGGETRGIQRAIKNLLAEINRIKAGVNSFMGSVSDLTNKIDRVLNSAVNLISQGAKVLMDKVRGYIVNKINDKISEFIDKLPPNKSADVNEKVEKVTDTLQCVFNKIIKGLSKLVKDILLNLVDNYINAPLCAVQEFLSSLLKSVLDQVTGAIQTALSIVNSIFGVVSSIAAKVTDVLGIISGVLNFLSCDEPLDCSADDQWSFWNGASCKLDKVSADLDKITSGLVSSPDTPPCNTSQLPCGPPEISISGPVGEGLIANPIISATGSILAIDIVNGGSGYVSPPTVSVTQNCNNGGGAVIKPILDYQKKKKDKSKGDPASDNEDNKDGIDIGIGDTTGTGGVTGNDGTVGIGSIIGFDIFDPGTGYLPTPDGSTGGDGFTFSQPCDTIIKRASSGYESAKSPGTVISVLPNDVIYLPKETTVEIYDSNGELVETVKGLGQLTPITVNSSGTFTSPKCIESQIPLNYNVYPVTLQIDRVIINESGTNYDSTDKIIVNPSNGAVLEPIYDKVGALTGVNIINPGIGFTEYPSIFIESENGIGAEIIPQFGIVRMVDIAEENDIIPRGIEIIKVVDCVGKIPPKTTFNIVPT